MRKDLRDLRNGKKTRSRKLNHRLSTLPYRKFTESLDCKFHEYGLEARRIDARRTPITGPTTRTRARRIELARKNSPARIAVSSSTHSMSHA
ncbi:MAG: hypothetical protein DRN30_00490 [Thermoplasmata archaeon]|nr:MAG: hypothetical protein DRN30_00490 [Thermoplasmata archaeon]